MKIKKVLTLFLSLVIIGSFSACTSKASNATTSTTKGTEKKVELPISQTKDNITIKLTKVEQDSDSLKIFVTYTDNTKDQLKPNRSDDKVVDNGKQLNCDAQFNMDRVDKLKLAHTDWMEPGTTADDVILFTPAQSDKINIALYPNGVRFAFDNIPVIKK